MKNRSYINIQNVMDESYVPMPNWLIFDDEFSSISSDAKILYSFLKNRCKLSIKNRWYDSNNRVYIICKREDMAAFLHCCVKKTTSIVNELLEKGLIEEKRNGQGKPNFIYVLMSTFSSCQELEYENDDDKDYNFQNGINYVSRREQETSLEPNNVQTNNINNINKDVIKILDTSSDIIKISFKEDDKKYIIDGMIFNSRQMSDIQKLLNSINQKRLNSNKNNLFAYLHKLYDRGLADENGNEIKSLFNYISYKFISTTNRELEEKRILNDLAENGDEYAKQQLNFLHV